MPSINACGFFLYAFEKTFVIFCGIWVVYLSEELIRKVTQNRFACLISIHHIVLDFILHHDLQSDIKNAISAFLAYHQLLTGPMEVPISTVQVLTPENLPKEIHSRDGKQ